MFECVSIDLTNDKEFEKIIQNGSKKEKLDYIIEKMICENSDFFLSILEDEIEEEFQSERKKLKRVKK